MSIINEALKKAQETSRQQVAEPGNQAPVPAPNLPPDTQIPSPPAAPHKTYKQPAKKPGRFWPVLIAVVAIIAGGMFFLNSFFKKAFLPAHSSVASPVLAPAQSGFIKEETRRDASAAPPRNNAPDLPVLNLSGIVYDDEKPYAIVNNKVMLKGDMIDGATLTEINRESVKFVFNDREFEISSK